MSICRRVAGVILGLVSACWCVGFSSFGRTAVASVPPSGQPIGSDDDGLRFQVDLALGLVPRSDLEDYYAAADLAFENRLADCMANEGFEYRPTTTAREFQVIGSPEYAEQFGFGTYTLLEPLPIEAVEDPNEEVVAGLSDAAADAWYAALDDCYATTDYAGSDFWTNSGILQLVEDFEVDVANDPRMIEALDGWMECMAAAGFEYGSRDEMLDEWQGADAQVRADEFRASEAWLPESDGHEEWAELVGQEVAVAVADAGCYASVDEVRADVVEELRPELIDLITTTDWSATTTTSAPDP